MRAGCPRLVSTCVFASFLALLPYRSASAQAVIKVGDDYFDRLMRIGVVEASPTPGHFLLQAKYASRSLLSFGLVGEGRVLDTRFIDVGVIGGLMWYRYEVQGLANDVIGNLNQALGVSAYFFPDAPVSFNLYAGYNLYYGANVPYGAALPEGSERPDSNLELQPFFYATGAAVSGTKGVLSMMFRDNDGQKERSKTYASMTQAIGPVDVGLVYDQLKSSANRSFALDGNAPELYEISALTRWNFDLAGGKAQTGAGQEVSLTGYIMAKVGKSLNVTDGTSFDREWADGDTTFGVLEASYYWMGGVSYSGRNGFGWRAGVDYGLGKSNKPDDGGFISLAGKELRIEATYMRKYVASDLFGPRVVPWSVNLGFTLR